MNIDAVMRLQREYAQAQNKYNTAKNTRGYDPTKLVILGQKADEAHRRYQAAWNALQEQVSK
jgi:hypothetical protein